MNCLYCDKYCKNKNSLTQHQIRCKLNPDAIYIKSNFIEYNNKVKNKIITKEFTNQFTKSKKLNLDPPIVSEVTKNKMSKSKKGLKLTIETKEKIKKAMQRVVREKPESYSSSNINGRNKRQMYNGIMLDSSWEVLFAEWCDKNNILWKRPINGFEYELNGKRIYYPDFFLPEYDMYIEVKGYIRPKDIIKWNSVTNLKIIKQEDIKSIKEGNFVFS